MDREDLMFIEQVEREEREAKELEKEIAKRIKAFDIEVFAEKLMGKTMEEVRTLAEQTEIPYELGSSSITFETLEYNDGDNELLFFMNDDDRISDMIACEG